MKKLKSICLSTLFAIAIGLVTVSCSDDSMDDLRVDPIEDVSLSGGHGSGHSGLGGGTNPPPPPPNTKD